jgi:hypothetical protein
VADRGETRILITSMTEPDVREITRAPWVHRGLGCQRARHLRRHRAGEAPPRSYGTHARILGPCVRDWKLFPSRPPCTRARAARPARWA